METHSPGTSRVDREWIAVANGEEVSRKGAKVKKGKGENKDGEVNL